MSNFVLQRGDITEFKNIIEISRYALPVLALLILGSCLFALLRRKPQPVGDINLYNATTNEYYPLISRETSVGRNKSCDIVLNFPTVSRQHAVIVCEKDGWYITSVTKTGTPLYVNGKKVTEAKHPLRSGDTISMGEINLIFDDR